MAGIWRNAYYLSTSIEENNIRKYPAKSMSTLEFPQKFNPLKQDNGDPASSPVMSNNYNSGDNFQSDKQQQSFYGQTSPGAGVYNGYGATNSGTANYGSNSRP